MSWEVEQIGGCTLYRGMAEEVLPMLEPVDAIITDPPYHGLKGGLLYRHNNVGLCTVSSRTVGTELGTTATFALFQARARYGAIVFCSYLCLDETVACLGGERKALISWYKRNSAPPVQNVPWQCVEFAWAVQYAPGIAWGSLRTHLDIPMLQAGCFADERFVIGGKAFHPTQKPVALMHALLLPGMQSVCDPYMGLGTTGVSCLRTGRTFVGIESEQRYFDVACQRIEEATRQGQLFLSPVSLQRPTQVGLFEKGFPV